MSSAAAAAATVAGIEIGKAVLIVLIQELMKRGMTASEIDSFYLKTKAEFLDNNPDKIPEV